MSQECYPDEFFRGISAKDSIDSGIVTDAAFLLDEEAREDGYQEMSINWNDDEGSLKTLFNQINPKKNNYQFYYAVKLNLPRIKDVLKVHILNMSLKFERSPMPNNKYHGNILVLKSVSTPMKRLIRNGLATIAGSNVIKNNNLE